MAPSLHVGVLEQSTSEVLTALCYLLVKLLLLPGEVTGELHLGLSLPSAIPSGPAFAGTNAPARNVPVSPFAAVGYKSDHNPSLAFKRQLSQRLSQQPPVGALAAGRRSSNSSSSAGISMGLSSNSKSMRVSSSNIAEAPTSPAAAAGGGVAGRFVRWTSTPSKGGDQGTVAESGEGANLSPLRANAGKLSARGRSGVYTGAAGGAGAAREGMAGKLVVSGEGGGVRVPEDQRGLAACSPGTNVLGSPRAQGKVCGSAFAAVAAAAAAAAGAATGGGSSHSHMERQLSRALERKSSASQDVPGGCCNGRGHHRHQLEQVLEQQAAELAAVEAAICSPDVAVDDFETALQLHVAAEVAERRAGHAWVLADLATQEAQEAQQEAHLLASLGLPAQHNVPLDLMVQPSLMRTRSSTSLGGGSTCDAGSRKGSCEGLIGAGWLGASGGSSSRKSSSEVQVGSGWLPSSRKASSEGQLSSGWFPSSRKASSEGQIGSGAFPSSRLGSSEGQIGGTGSRKGSSEVQIGPGWTGNSPQKSGSLSQHSLELSPLGQQPMLTASNLGSKIPRRETPPSAAAAAMYPHVPFGLSRSGSIPYAGEMHDTEYQSPPGSRIPSQLRSFKYAYPIVEAPDLAAQPERHCAGAASSYGGAARGIGPAAAAAAMGVAFRSKLPVSAADAKQYPSSYPVRAASMERQPSDAACLQDSRAQHAKHAAKSKSAAAAPVAFVAASRSSCLHNEQQEFEACIGAQEGQEGAVGYPAVPPVGELSAASRQGNFRSDSANSFRDGTTGQGHGGVVSSNAPDGRRHAGQEQGQEESVEHKGHLGTGIKARIDELRQRMQGSSSSGGGGVATALEASAQPEATKGGHNEWGVAVETRVKEAEAAIAAATKRAVAAAVEAGSPVKQKQHHHHERDLAHHDAGSNHMTCMHYQQQHLQGAGSPAMVYRLQTLDEDGSPRLDQVESVQQYPPRQVPLKGSAAAAAGAKAAPVIAAKTSAAFIEAQAAAAAASEYDDAAANAPVQNASPRISSFPAAIVGMDVGPQLPDRWLQLPQGGLAVAAAVDCYPQLPEQYPEAVASPTPSAPTSEWR